MGLYCFAVQNDQQDIVIKWQKSTNKLGFKKFLDFKKFSPDLCGNMPILGGNLEFLPESVTDFKYVEDDNIKILIITTAEMGVTHIETKEEYVLAIDAALGSCSSYVVTVNENNEQCFAYMTAAELMIHMIFWKPYVIYSKMLKRKVVINSTTFYNIKINNIKSYSFCKYYE